MAIAYEPVPNPPPAVVALIDRLGGAGEQPFSMVRLSQTGTMRDPPGRRWMRFSADQRILLTECCFTWHAHAGPLGSLSIVDALDHDTVRLSVDAFGLIPLVRSPKSPALVRGELMRYLAELAYAPDAMRLNRHLIWSVNEDGQLTVAAAVQDIRAEVTLSLDDHGRIDAIRANRPRLEGGTFVERAWRGRFSDYRRYRGRWLPFAAEVGWVLHGVEQTAWRGKLLEWEIS